MSLEPTPLIAPTPAPAPSGAPSPSSPPESVAPAAPSPSTPGATMRPEGLPDEFWDKDSGLRTKDLLGKFNELSEFHAKHVKTFENFPENPEDAGKFYTLPEQLLDDETAKSLPEGVKVEIDANHPLLPLILPVAHKYQIPPEAFQDMARAFAKHQLTDQLDFQKQLGEEAKKLGANADTRKEAVRTFLTGTLGEKHAGAILSNLYTAAQIEAVELLASKFSGQSNVVPLHQNRDDTPPETPREPGARIFTSMNRG